MLIPNMTELDALRNIALNAYSWLGVYTYDELNSSDKKKIDELVRIYEIERFREALLKASYAVLGEEGEKC